MELLIDVTEENIRNGKPGVRTCCMVTEALKLVLMPNVMCIVQHGKLELIMGEISRRIFFNKDLSEMIISYDKGERIEPFSFRIDIPCMFLKPTLIGFKRLWAQINAAGEDENPTDLPIPATIIEEIPELRELVAA